jgi:hypothetical protein
MDIYPAFNADDHQRELSKYYNCILHICAWKHLYDDSCSPVLNPDEAGRIRREFQERLEDAGWKRIEFVEAFGQSYL